MGNSPSSGSYVYQVPNTGDKQGESPVYRSITCRDKNRGELISKQFADVTTCYEGFLRGVKLYPKNPCLGIRRLMPDGKTRGEYVWESYQSVFNRVRDIASGLRFLGFEKDTKVGIYSINRPEWIISAQACYAQSYVSVPLYDTLGPEAVAYIINQSKIPVVICSGDKVDKFADQASICPTLKRIISMDPLPENKEIKGIELLYWGDVLKLGAEKKIGFDPAKPNDLATICYTSGTTGDPKGVMLSHNNLVSAVAGALNAGVDLTPTDVYISYLPLAHMYDRIVCEVCLTTGAAIGFYSGEILKLLDDITALQPTLFASVPRLFLRVHDKISQTVHQSGGISASIFEAGLAAKKEALKRNQGVESFFWDTLVFGKTKSKLGGRVRLIVTGAAPLNPDTHDFLKVTMCAPVVQGYGLTECCALATVQRIDDSTSGNVGAVVPCNDIKLIDVPDMGYSSKDDPPRGEVCIRGQNVFVGYYEMPDKTKEVLDDDGWFHTGDIGQINQPSGTLSIIDRKKNIFKLSQGEYVAAEKIEGVYTSNHYISQIFVYGDSEQSVLVAIVVPDAEAAKLWAEENGIKDSDLVSLCKSDKFREAIINEMSKAAKHAKLRGFEIVKDIYLEPNPFTVENDLLTPTFKMKRPQLKTKYTKVINDLYQKINSQTKTSTVLLSPTSTPAPTPKVEKKEEPKQTTTNEPSPSPSPSVTTNEDNKESTKSD